MLESRMMVGVLANVHRIQGDLPPDQAAAAYRAELEPFLGAGVRFDLILPTGGQLLWRVDAGAAVHLEPR
jgi:hypothetical protein